MVKMNRKAGEFHPRCGKNSYPSVFVRIIKVRDALAAVYVTIVV